MLKEAVNCGECCPVWNDETGFKCSPPTLDYKGNGKNQDKTSRKLFEQLKRVNHDLSWKIPLQVVKGDANNWFRKLKGLDLLKSAMVVGDGRYGAQVISKKVLISVIFVRCKINFCRSTLA